MDVWKVKERAGKRGDVGGAGDGSGGEVFEEGRSFRRELRKPIAK